MRKIEIKVLNPESIADAEKMMVFAARLTQRGHKIKDMNDLLSLFEKPFTKETSYKMSSLPHPTIQKFGVINIAIVGCSRRFLAQITRHQNEVKFMSSSLQYSDYSGHETDDDFCVPYSILGDEDKTRQYLSACEYSMRQYKAMIDSGIDGDTAGYSAPQGLRGALIVSATPYQWKHMIGQRTCRRNTDETRYIMFEIWRQLYDLDDVLFSAETTGPNCAKMGFCQEKKMSCGKVYSIDETPRWRIGIEFPKVFYNGNPIWED